MAYFAPYIDATGFHMPSYSDIRDQLMSNARGIFGDDIYLENDSQDYQWISSVSNMVYDAFLTSQAAYNSRGPSTAVGSGLDIVVKINGLKRAPAVFSTCNVTLTGTPGTVITGGVVSDINKNKWNLTSPITLDGTGHVTTLASCQISGPVTVNVGELNTIVTPTYGWTSVTNAALPGTVGSHVQSDASLRSLQAINTAKPSRTVLEGLKGAIASVQGVTRSIVYENDTNATDAAGLPAHSMTAVVEGGSNADIAQEIFSKKGPGAYTNGSVSTVITDFYGSPTTVRFYRPTYLDIDVVINVKALAGYTTETTATIKNAVAAYISGLSIGDDLSVSSLWGAALSANIVPTKPLFSITGLTAAKHSLTQGTADIVADFNEVTRGNVSYITVNVT
ncbi:baseplate J/gp47 family protein [Paenibacillus sp. 2RAB27]|uniref:baseplate J/gp47 family protein n=1 Tax=Paenibacillus sp. 2RAB27 TaxID=3232991 RepID=UPI003F9DA946